MPIRCALYARVSTTDQHTQNQLTELRVYAQARGWTITREYLDGGVSGAKERRQALDDLTRDARRRQFDVVACWRLDRLGRNLKHLITLLDGPSSFTRFVNTQTCRPTPGSGSRKRQRRTA